MSKIITLTDSAQRHIETLLANNTASVLMVSINNKGCSGHSYDYSFVDEAQLAPFDEKVALTNGVLAIRADSIIRVLGSTLDVEHNSLEEKFVWHNPQATNTCGCGKSMSF